MKLVILYSLSEPDSGEVRYIGKTCKSLRERVSQHIAESNTGKPTYKCRWVRALLRRGLQPIGNYVSIVSRERASHVEREWIAKLRKLGARLVNSTDGGDGLFGFKHSETTRSKISKAHMGMRHSPEILAKLSAKLRGRKLSAEHCRKKSIAQTGRKMSPESIAKTATANRGKKKSDAARAKMSAVWTPEKRALFSQSQIGNQYGLGTKRTPQWCQNHSDIIRELYAQKRQRNIPIPRGETSANHKLTNAGVVDIRMKYQTGNYSYRELAAEYHVDRSIIGDVVKRKTWAHVPDDLTSLQNDLSDLKPVAKPDA